MNAYYCVFSIAFNVFKLFEIFLFNVCRDTWVFKNNVDFCSDGEFFRHSKKKIARNRYLSSLTIENFKHLAHDIPKNIVHRSLDPPQFRSTSVVPLQRHWCRWICRFWLTLLRGLMSSQSIPLYVKYIGNRALPTGQMHSGTTDYQTDSQWF